MKRTLGLLLLLPSTVYAWAGFAETTSSPLETAIWITLIAGYATLIPILAFGGVALFSFWAIAQPLFTLGCGFSVGALSYRAKRGSIQATVFAIGTYALTTLITNMIGLQFFK